MASRTVTNLELLKSLPPGFGFYPKDEVLVSYYLKNKLHGKENLVSHIPQVDLCCFEPWQLPAFSVIKSADQEWYFFTPIHRKFVNGLMASRKTKVGFWKPTGKHRAIKGEGSSQVIGSKRTLVFYEGRACRCSKTDWVIHEYRPHDHSFAQVETKIVLCRLKKIPGKLLGGSVDIQSNNEEPQSSHAVSDLGNQGREEIMQEDYAFDDEHLIDLLRSPRQNNDISGLLSAYTQPKEQLIPAFPFDNVQSDANEEDIDDVNSYLVQDEFCIERTNALANDSTPQESLIQYEAFPSTMTIQPEYVQAAKAAESAATYISLGGSDDSDINGNIEEEESDISEYDFSQLETSSIESYVNSLARRKAADDFDVLRGATREELLQIELLGNEQEKGNCKADSNKLQETKCNACGKPVRNQSSVHSWKASSFFHMEAPFSSQQPRPPSVYLVNTIIGLLLLVVVIWDLVSCGAC